MSIDWAESGTAQARAVHSNRIFTQAPGREKEHPRRPAGGAQGSAAAVLAGAGVAAAARFGGAAALACLNGGGFAIGHFSLLFRLLNSERITI